MKIHIADSRFSCGIDYLIGKEKRAFFLRDVPKKFMKQLTPEDKVFQRQQLDKLKEWRRSIESEAAGDFATEKEAKRFHKALPARLRKLCSVTEYSAIGFSEVGI